MAGGATGGELLGCELAETIQRVGQKQKGGQGKQGSLRPSHGLRICQSADDVQTDEGIYRTYRSGISEKPHATHGGSVSGGWGTIGTPDGDSDGSALRGVSELAGRVWQSIRRAGDENGWAGVRLGTRQACKLVKTSPLKLALSTLCTGFAIIKKIVSVVSQPVDGLSSPPPPITSRRSAT
jgi:hypothetical protein